MFELPMFPLSLVAFPGAMVPLHLFEPRYLALLEDVLAADARFGIVLITRGKETGGGDLRADVGTVVEVVQWSALPDDRRALMAVGRERMRVENWLPDDPYPRAVVETLPEPTPTNGDRARLEATLDAYGETLLLRELLGERVPEQADVRRALSDDPGRAAFEVASLSGLGLLDAQAVLTAATIEQRFALLDEALVGITEILRFRVGSDGGTDTS